jgi:hypothetical protein
VANSWIDVEDNKTVQEKIWHQAGKAAITTNTKNWRVHGNLSGAIVTSEPDQGGPPAIASSAVVNKYRDSFSDVLANVRTASKYEWAYPRARKQARRHFDQWERRVVQSSEDEASGSGSQPARSDIYHRSEASGGPMVTADPALLANPMSHQP